MALLEGLDLAGWIVTGDAKFTQKKLVAKIIEKHGDCVLTAKDNQPTLVADIATLFDDPQVVAETITTTRRIDTHGSRIEVRQLRASSALSAKYLGWPGVRQVFRIERWRRNKRTGLREHRVVYGITTLPRRGLMPDAWPSWPEGIGASRTACIGCGMWTWAKTPVASARARRPR